MVNINAWHERIKGNINAGIAVMEKVHVLAEDIQRHDLDGRSLRNYMTAHFSWLDAGMEGYAPNEIVSLALDGAGVRFTAEDYVPNPRTRMVPEASARFLCRALFGEHYRRIEAWSLALDGAAVEDSEG